MREIKFSDKMRNRSRNPHLLLVKKDGELVKFIGKSIPGVCVITSESYEKNGKWSGSSYSISLADGVVPVEVLCPFEGWGQTFTDMKAGFSSLIYEDEDREKLKEMLTEEFIEQSISLFYSETGEAGLALASAKDNAELLKGLSGTEVV